MRRRQGGVDRDADQGGEGRVDLLQSLLRVGLVSEARGESASQSCAVRNSQGSGVIERLGEILTIVGGALDLHDDPTALGIDDQEISGATFERHLPADDYIAIAEECRVGFSPLF